MRRTSPLLALLLTVSACAGSDGAAVSHTTLAASGPTSVAESTSTSGSVLDQEILGEWELIEAESPQFDPEDEAGLIAITFTPDQLSGMESCAPFSGTYRMEGDVLVFVQVETTAEGCGDWTDEVALIRFAGENPTAVLQGDRLTLLFSEWRLEFGRVP